MGIVTVVAEPSELSFALAQAAIANRAVEWPGLGRRDPSPLRLVVVRDSASMDAVSRGRAPGWGAGLALPGQRTIILRADLEDPGRTLRHELAHLALHEAVSGRVPLWFDEGYASYAAGEWDRLEELRLSVAMATMAPPELRELDGWLRGNAPMANLAYALAITAVLELSRRNPSGTLAPLFTRLRAGDRFETALLATTGLTADRFESVWQRRLRRQYNILTWLIAGGFWFLVALLLASALWYRRRADRPRRAALDQGWVVPGDTGAPTERLPGASGVDPTARS